MDPARAYQGRITPFMIDRLPSPRRRPVHRRLIFDGATGMLDASTRAALVAVAAVADADVRLV